jgi:hypothetical protein
VRFRPRGLQQGTSGPTLQSYTRASRLGRVTAGLSADAASPTTRCGPGLRTAGGVERSRATDAAALEATGTPAEPLGLLSGHGGIRGTGTSHSAWPNTSYVINALANSMRGGGAGSTRLRIVLSQQLRQLRNVRRDPSRLIFGEQLGGGLSPRLVLERPSLTVPAEISTCVVLLSI